MATSFSDFLNDIGTLKDNLKPVEGNPIFEVIKKWANERIEVAKNKLAESGRVGSGALGQSIRPVPNIEDGNYIVEIFANDYWDYINSGVNGLQGGFGSPYSFRTLSVGSNMLASFSDFIKINNIQSLNYTDKEGRQISKVLQTANDFKSAAYVLARATKKKGIKPNKFMDETFDADAINELSELLGKAVVATFKGK